MRTLRREREERSRAEKTQQCLEEYKFLRYELEAIWSQAYSTTSFMLALVGLMVYAAYAQKNPATSSIILAMASLITWGGYRLMKVHSTRVWRIVGYMRRALEPNLKGVRWETRLYARHEAIKSCREKQRVDRDIFEGHVAILDWVNVAFAIGMLYSFVFFSGYCDFFGARIDQRWLLGACLLVPLAVLVLSWCRAGRFKRGGRVEHTLFELWEEKSGDGVIVADTEPSFGSRSWAAR